jgi:hypothetical protein
LSDWFAQQEAEIHSAHEKRIGELKQSIKIPDQPSNTEFMKRVQQGVDHLNKQSGLNELMH